MEYQHILKYKVHGHTWSSIKHKFLHNCMDFHGFCYPYFFVIINLVSYDRGFQIQLAGRYVREQKETIKKEERRKPWDGLQLELPSKEELGAPLSLAQQNKAIRNSAAHGAGHRIQYMQIGVDVEAGDLARGQLVEQWGGRIPWG